MLEQSRNQLKERQYSVEMLFREIQCQLSRITEENCGFISVNDVRFVGACDTSYSPSIAVTAIVVEDILGSGREKIISIDNVLADYIASLFMVREAPPILAALRKTTTRPDLLLVNAHGIAHPRKCGLATYVGKISGIPTIGFAHNIIAGAISQDEKIIMGVNEVVGYHIKSSSSHWSFFVSPGFRVRSEDIPGFLSILSKKSGSNPLYPPILTRAHTQSISAKKELDQGLLRKE